MSVIERRELRPETISVLDGDKPEGPVAAALIAGGIGAAALGFLAVLSEASAGAKRWLEWNSAVGSLSGKTVMTVLVWLVAWAGLHLGFRKRSVDLRTAFIVTLVLVAVGVAGTFPTVFQAFATD